MSNFPQRYFTEDNVLVRTDRPGNREPYTSGPLGRKFNGVVKGVYTGFTPSALGSVLTLSPDPGEGISNLKVQSRDEPAGMDVTVESDINLDFSGAVAGDFLPDGILVLARAHYTESGDTSAEIVTQTKTTTETLYTVGATPEEFDLTGLGALGSLEAGSLSIAVTVDGYGADTITDDGNGNLSSAGPALPTGSIDYETGILTGTTAALAALSMVFVTRSRLPNPNEVLLCRVTGTPGAIVVNDTPPADRDVPIAFTDYQMPYGFLESGSIEALAAAVDILNEVIAARTDLQGVAHASLKERLDTDLGAVAMATRLGKQIRVLRSNVYSAPAGSSSINVSGSFTENDREWEPKITLNGTGDETTVGAIAAPNDTVRNVAIALNADSHDRLLDNETNRNVLVGRIVQEDDFLLDGTITFTNALTTVTGDASAQFLTQLEVGDTVQGADGKFYEVASITSDTQLALSNAYQGATAGSANLLRRRINLVFLVASTGSEVAFPLEETINVEFFFPAFVDLSRGNFDAYAMLHRPAERPPVPDATTTIPGKVENAVTGGFVGSILLQNKGVAVGGGPFHTLNFTNATIIETAPGVLDVISIGPTGPTGPGGGLGPPGDPGDPGPSITQRSTFEPSAEFPLGPTGPNTLTHTVDFGYDLDFLSGGIARYRDSGFWISAEVAEIDDIRVDSAQIGTIEVTGGTGAIDQFVIAYLDACGHVP